MNVQSRRRSLVFAGNNGEWKSEGWKEMHWRYRALSVVHKSWLVLFFLPWQMNLENIS